MYSERKIDDIMWPLVILHICQVFIVPDTVFMLMGIIILLLCNFYKNKIIIPHISGLGIYVTYLLFITLLGITKYSLYLVIRDVFYEFSNIIFILLGYALCKRNIKRKSLLKTFVISNSILSVITIIIGSVLIGSRGYSFADLRVNFSNGIYSISILLPLCIIYKILMKKDIISKKIDKNIIILWTLQILLNFSRTAILIVLSVLFISFLILTIYKKINLNILKKIIKIVLLIAILIILLLKIIPDSIIERFDKKLKNSIVEISTNNSFNNDSEAQSNWRGYEIACAKKFWREENIFDKIFGRGNGTIIPIRYIPTQWKDIVDIQDGKKGVTVLHNTYYTLLCKGGVIAVFLFIYFLLCNIYIGLKRCNSTSNFDIICGLFTIGLFIYLIINAYIIRALFQNDIQMTSSMLIGWMAMLNRREKDEERIL